MGGAIRKKNIWGRRRRNTLARRLYWYKFKQNIQDENQKIILNIKSLRFQMAFQEEVKKEKHSVHFRIGKKKLY